MVVVGLFALLVLGVLAGVFVVYRQTSPLLDLLGLVALLAVTCSGFMAFSYRRGKNEEEASHLAELMEVERQLDKTARRYRSLLEGAGVAIFVFNADSGILVEVNRRGVDLLGHSREEMAALRGKDLIPEDEQERFASFVMRVARRGRGRLDRITFRRKSGERFFGEVDARLIDLGDERLVHVTVRDITFKYRAEREIRQRNRELSTLIRIISHANRERELKTVLDVTLREMVDVFGASGGGIHLRREEGRLKPAATLNVPDGVAALLAGEEKEGGLLGRVASFRAPLAYEDLAASDVPGCTPAAVQGAKGFAGVPLSARNRVIGVMYLLSDEARRFTDEEMRLCLSVADQIGIVIEHARLFDELKWKSDELLRSFRLLEKSSHELALSQHHLRANLLVVEQANQELERLDRMKSSFLGMISHEFRTPLTSIMSGTEFLISSRTFDQDADSRRILDMIHQGGERLSEIVDNILKLTRLEATGAAVTTTAIHLSQIVDHVIASLAPMLEERGLKVVHSNLERLPYCSGDRECLEEIFTELLENSVKFTPDGGTIFISARVVDRRALAAKREILGRFNAGFYAQMGDHGYLEVEVRDNGIGVSPNEQVKIFDKFYEIGEIRHHSSGKHKFQGKGTGLGLAIVKGMVEAHGGMVWMESPGIDPDARFGSAFYVLIPLEGGPRQEPLPFAGGGEWSAVGEGVAEED
ncbi:histidine kinase [Geobacter pickeringii]|uniref:histidine kinase n=1 Tax=Geobacter pickeringii TaxID=345632 RepID=A0A0B5BE66_9BACT|nr:histidine kinase [Geobacter pickeringii]